jgi:biotin carboxyl carrier protein
MSTTYQVTIGEQTLRVEVRRTGDAVSVRVNAGEELVVALTRVRAAVYGLVVDGRRAELMARVTDDSSVDLALEGHELRAEVVDEARARLASLAGGRVATHTRRELKAPMPGLLVKVLCAVGDAIEAGEPLAVLQAMKMENELSLPRGGTVSAINAQPGQTVEQGQVLVVVE